MCNERWTAGLLTAVVLATCSSVGAVQPPQAEIDSVDLRPVFAQAGLAPRAQGKRPTCSVFTLVGAIEFALAHEGESVPPLSIEFASWACHEAVHRRRDGGFFSDIWKGFEAFGICDESDLPYREKLDRDLRPDEATIARAAARRGAGLRLHWIKPWDPKTGLTAAQLAEIERVLRGGWPVCAGLRWPKDEGWTDGVLDWAPREGVRDGHSVLFVGYRDDPEQPGGGVFLMHNSGKGLRTGAMTYEYARTYTNDALWIGTGVPRPPIVPASAWGSAPQPIPDECRHVPERITIHHAGVLWKPGDDPLRKLRGLQAWGQRDKDWPDVPYHFLIAPDGRVFAGRPLEFEGETNTEYDVTGHALVQLWGNFEEQRATAAQLETTARLCAWLCAEHAIPVDSIRAHRDWSTQTSCPGKDLYRYVEKGDLRAWTDSILRGESPEIRPREPLPSGPEVFAPVD